MTVHQFASQARTEAPRDPCFHLIPGPIDRDLVLASTSASLRRLIEAAGLAVRMAPPDREEMNIFRASLRSMSEPTPADISELQARVRTDNAAALFPDLLVIGAQQIISIDGQLRETPRTQDAACELLLELQGRTHQLHSAVALAEQGQITWSSIDTAHLTMRSLTTKFIGRYLAAAAHHAVGSPGAYQLDGIGLQLFEHVGCTYPAALGAPVFRLLARLREIGFIAS